MVTPRFVPSCDEELLVGLGDLVKKYEPEGLRIQTHLAECLPEVNRTSLICANPGGIVWIYSSQSFLHQQHYNKHWLSRERFCISEVQH